MKNQSLLLLATLLLATACGGAGGGAGGDSYDPKEEHNPEVPTYSSGQTNWMPDNTVVPSNEVTVTNGPLITAKKGAAIGQFQNGNIIVAGGANASGVPTKSVQMISSANVVTSANDLAEEVVDPSSIMVVPRHLGMMNEFFVAGGKRLDGRSSANVQRFSNTGVNTIQDPLYFGTYGGEMHYDMSLVSIVGGYWEAYDFNTVQPDGINVMYFGSEWWTAAPNEDLIRTPVYAMTGHKVVNLNGGSVSVGGKYSGKDVYLLQYGNQTFMENGSLDIAVQGGHDAWGEENGSIITVIGGAVLNRDCTTAMQKFDFDYNTQVTTHMNIGRCGHSSVELANGDIYVVGGRKSYSDSSERTATIEKYDASTQTWSVVGKLAHARSGHKVFKRGTSQLVVVGGTDASGAPIAQTEIITY